MIENEEVEQDYYTLAAARVANTPALDAHADTIIYDRREGDEHWQWVATAAVAEIVDWAKKIESTPAV